MKKRLKIIPVLILLITIFGSINLVFAADFPNRPIEWYNPWGLGTVTGIAMNIVGDAAAKYLGQNILVMPATGGGGIVGAAKVARAKPDGYTLLLPSSASNGIVLYMNNDVPYKNSDFEFIAEIGVLEMGLIVGPNSPFTTLEDYIAYAKKNPSAIKMATIGIGSVSHLTLELLKLEGGNFKVDLVPYKTSTEVRTAVLGGHCHAAFSYGGVGGTADEFKLVQEGGGRVLAVATKSRLKPYPSIPTLTERGYNVVLNCWYGVAAPKNIPKGVSQKLKDAFYAVLKDPQVMSKLEKVGLKPEFRNSEEFTSYIRDYEKLVKRIIEEGKIPKN